MYDPWKKTVVPFHGEPTCTNKKCSNGHVLQMNYHFISTTEFVIWEITVDKIRIISESLGENGTLYYEYRFTTSNLLWFTEATQNKSFLFFSCKISAHPNFKHAYAPDDFFTITAVLCNKPQTTSKLTSVETWAKQIHQFSLHLLRPLVPPSITVPPLWPDFLNDGEAKVGKNWIMQHKKTDPNSLTSSTMVQSQSLLQKFYFGGHKQLLLVPCVAEHLAHLAGHDQLDNIY